MSTQDWKGTFNGILLDPKATGFEISGGTTSKKLTLDTDLTASAIAAITNGTWTPEIRFGGFHAGVTYSADNSGLFTRVGLIVHATGLLSLTAKGTSTGAATIFGLPYLCQDAAGYSAAALRFDQVSFADHPQGYVNKNSWEIILSEITNAGVLTALDDTNFTDDSSIVISVTYRANA